MYTNIVFGGGGIRGIAYIGSLTELEKMGILQYIRNYAGSSVGALVASLISIGYTVQEIQEIMMTMDFSKIIDDQFGFVRDFYNFLNKYGYASGDYIYKLLGKYIKTKTGNADYTLTDLYRDKKIKLIITTTNLNTRAVEYLSVDHSNPKYSQIPIRKAIRMSISIPFVFQPVYYNECYFCDGGVLMNYPIHCFDEKTLGLKLVQDHPEKEEINNLYQYSYSYIETFLAENDRRSIEDHVKNTIFIKTKNYALSKFDLTLTEKEELMQQGKDAVKNYFK